MHVDQQTFDDPEILAARGGGVSLFEFVDRTRTRAERAGPLTSEAPRTAPATSRVAPP